MAIAESLDMATDTQKMNFRRIFMRDPETLGLHGHQRCTRPELHEKRSELKKLMRGLSDAASKDKRNFTKDEDEAFELGVKMMRDISDAFDKEDERNDLERSLMGINGVGNSTTVEMWSDAKTGRSVPVLGKEHRFQDFCGDKAFGAQVNARDYFSGIAGHVARPEVRDALSTSMDTAGGYLVPEHISAEVIDLFRAKNTAIQAGARSFPMVDPTVRICRLVEDPSAAWVAENHLIPEDSTMSIGALEFHAKKLTCLVKASTELLADASNAGVVIQNAISAAMAGELDRAVYYGGGGTEPCGIFNDNGITVYTLGTGAGAKLAGYDNLLIGCKKIIEANAPLPTSAVMSPRTLIDFSLIKDGDGLPLTKPDLIKNISFFDTTKIPNTEKVGASDDCSSILLGTFQHLVIGIRSNLEITILRERWADYGQVGFLCTMRADVATFQPKAFCRINGIRPE